MKKIEINEDLIKIIISAILLLLALKIKSLKNIFLILSYIIISYELYINSFKSLLKKEIFDENFLMIIATLGAIFIKEYEESVVVILLFQLGEYLSDLAVNNSKKKITALMDLKCDYINLKTAAGIEKKDIKEIKLGDIFIVKPGEKVGLDGIVIDGEGLVDTKALTGESTPRHVMKNSNLLSGFISEDSILTVKATSIYETSTSTKIINIIENSNEVKTDTEKFITKFSKIYTPIVVILAILIVIIPTLLGKDFHTYLYTALVFLVTSCPCALVISIPLGYFCGIGRCSKENVLIKGSRELDKLSKIKSIALDKTGTITEGIFQVEKIKPTKITKDELLKLAAHTEYYSLHPIARAILKKYSQKIDETKIKNFQELSGKGVKACYENSVILLGNKELMKENNITIEEVNSIGSTIYISKDNKYIGYLTVADKIRKSSYSLVDFLEKLGIKDIVILSGDKKENVEKVCQEIGINKYYSELLPTSKVEKISKMKEKNLTAFVGDGINDAPVLKISDLGISMGNIGSDAAIEASDIVLMKDDLSKIPEAIKIAKLTNKIVKFNISFAITAKIIILLLGIFGYTTIWLAVFADVGVTLLAVLNTLRIMIKK